MNWSNLLHMAFIIYLSGCLSLIFYVILAEEKVSEHMPFVIIWPLIPPILAFMFIRKWQLRREKRDTLDGVFPVDQLFPNVTRPDKPDTPA